MERTQNYEAYSPHETFKREFLSQRPYLTLATLAKNLEMSEEQLDIFLTGEVPFTSDFIYRFCLFFGASLTDWGALKTLYEMNKAIDRNGKAIYSRIRENGTKYGTSSPSRKG